jgi:Glycosyl transferase 4-like domain
VSDARRPAGDRPEPRASLLCLSPSFAPDTTPTAIRAGKLLARLSAQWDITVLTETGGPGVLADIQDRGDGKSGDGGPLRVEVVGGGRARKLLAKLRRLRLARLLELVVWPDGSVFWVPSAVVAGKRIARTRRPSAIVVFMMPYSAGLAGVLLSLLTGLPLILNLDDSPTCTDMHPHFATRLHHLLAKALEDLYARRADAIVYVSRTNLEMVRARQPERVRRKFHLVRYGAEPADFRSQPQSEDVFEIAYVGGMTGWWSLIEQDPHGGRLGAAYAAWANFGHYELMRLDQRTSSPAIVGQAILEAIAERPGWAGRVCLRIYGNSYPDVVVARALESAGVQSVVSVFGALPHEQIADVIARADLLFLTLPKRLDRSPGGRISAKTYEYLATDRPILAAVSPGENWSYLEDKPGVWLLEPDDRRGMMQAIRELAAAKFAGEALTFDRSHLHSRLSYATRASQFATVIQAGIARRGGR